MAGPGVCSSRVAVVVPSTNELASISAFKGRLASDKYDLKLLIIDEGDDNIRKKNEKILCDFPHAFYGRKEREEWFSERFGSTYKRELSVIPSNCHAESSFGFLVAFEEGYDFVIELDDDVFPEPGDYLANGNLVDQHASNLFGNGGVSVCSQNHWYNSIENLKLTGNSGVFPRGHPYARDVRTSDYDWSKEGGECILNMGLWKGCLDLDALTILYHSGLNGRVAISCKGLRREKIIMRNGTYSAICSMNTSFFTQIVPAFFQLHMNFMGIDRFDDIWSGLFLKKIADHLGRKICLGKPLVNHDRRPRDTFRDLKKEIEGMVLNEKLWVVVDEAPLRGANYSDAYLSLIEYLHRNLHRIAASTLQKKYWAHQCNQMRKWVQVVDGIS